MTVQRPVTTADQGAMVARLSDGRLHFQHGPIDIILQSWGDAEAVRAAEVAAARRFSTVLSELCAELPALRSEEMPVTGPVARQMAAAVAPFRPAFITPMAAVAGAVADTIIAQFVRPGIARAYANNGGDIALYLGQGQSLDVGISAVHGFPAKARITHDTPARGIATSGWRGRSWSLGIADSVTVLAGTAAMADAAATMIANEINLPDHPGIGRQPASSLQPDTDLGARLVTVSVPALSESDRAEALNRGADFALRCQRAGLVEAAALFLQGEMRVIGQLKLLPEARNHV